MGVMLGSQYAEGGEEPPQGDESPVRTLQRGGWGSGVLLAQVENKGSPLTTLPARLNKNNPFIGNFNHSKTETMHRSRMPHLLTRCRSVSHEELVPFESRSLLRKALEFQTHIPSTPELCGIQGIVPRQSGLQVVNKIGEGSFGKVVLVLNRRNRSSWGAKCGTKRHLVGAMPSEGQNLVIKLVERDESEVGTIRDCVEREIRIHAKCEHTNIVRFFGFYEQGPRHVLMLLGHVDGRELHEILRERVRLGEGNTAPIFLQITHAVEYLHSISIVHRDIKPRNVLVTEADRAYLIDLGLAVDLSSEDDLEASKGMGIVGTLGYVAPEVAKEQGMCPGATPQDMWAMGVLCYETVFGFQPFQPYEMFGPGEVEFPDSTWGMTASPELCDMLRGLLDKDGSKRMTASEAANHPWFFPVASLVAGLQANDPASVPSSPAPVFRKGSTVAPMGEDDEGEDYSQAGAEQQHMSEEEKEECSNPDTPGEWPDYLSLQLEVDVNSADAIEWGGMYHYQRYDACVVMVEGGHPGMVAAGAVGAASNVPSPNSAVRSSWSMSDEEATYKAVPYEQRRSSSAEEWEGAPFRSYEQRRSVTVEESEGAQFRSSEVTEGARFRSYEQWRSSAAEDLQEGARFRSSTEDSEGVRFRSSTDLFATGSGDPAATGSGDPAATRGSGEVSATWGSGETEVGSSKNLKDLEEGDELPRLGSSSSSEEREAANAGCTW